MDGLFLAYSLSGAAGIRSALVMFVVALSVHFGRLHPDPSLYWVGSWWVILLAGGASVVDFLGDKVPVLDHALHGVHTLLAPAVGAISAASGYHGDATGDIMLAVLGGGNALLVHSTRSAVRAASSMTTLGAANPFISLLEDVAAGCFILVALLVPALTAVAVVLMAIAGVWMLKKAKDLIVAR